METAQKLVDDAAKAAGYTEKVYHGTAQFGFTKPVLRLWYKSKCSDCRAGE